MNTSSLKSFAPAVRTQLMEAVGRKLDYVLSADTPDLRQAAAQVASLRREATKNRAALVERVAYTWFNRFAALRFLDAQGWHPFKARVLTPATPEETQPELLKLLRTGSLPAELHPHTDLQRLNDLLDGRLPTAIAGADPQGEAYRGLILAACRFYHTLLPDVFDKLNDESELLLPDDLLTATSVAEGFRTEITDADCLETDASGKSRANVEILGWLYQFYISEKKDAVMARKSAVPTEDIPAVTQLFTPHWIVRYLVENSLGRLWLLNRPSSRLRDHMPYYIESGTDSSSEASAKEDFLLITKPEEIRLCDPAVGSGHMLTYAFDLFTLIYEEEGYTPSEIPALILRHNLHGLEICPRAAQLAELALVFKAREKSRRFFQPEHLVRPNITELKDIRFDDSELQAYFKALGCQPSSLHPQLTTLLHQFEEAKNFGSLIQPCLSEAEIQAARNALTDHCSLITSHSPLDLMVGASHLKVLRVLEQAEALTQRYHVVVANPPYLGKRGMNNSLKNFAESRFPNSKLDTFAIFIERCCQLTNQNGYASLVTMQSWMFLGSYQNLRANLLDNHTLMTMAHLGASAFDSIAGEIVQTTAFVLSAHHVNCEFPATFIRLINGGDESKKNADLLSGRGRFKTIASDFRNIPGMPFIYNAPQGVFRCFKDLSSFSGVGQPKVGMQTANNDLLLRRWFEISSKFSHPITTSSLKWIAYQKGGGYRRWYGSNEYLLRYEGDGSPVLAQKNATLSEWSIATKLKCTWSDIASGKPFSTRLVPPDSFYDISGHCYFPNLSNYKSLLALTNSIPFGYIINLINPTIHFQVGDVGRVPVPQGLPDSASEIADSCITLARTDWDNFETSWDFRDQPMLRLGLKGVTLEASWRNWEAQCTAAIRRMQELETENNRLFIAAYGLDGELQPEVPEEQITLARAEARRDMAAFLSYAVGCMMGRYSLSAPGLILANAGDTLEDYLRIVAEKTVASDQSSVISEENGSFAPDDDAIIPVLDGEWFEDDIVARTREFLRVTFGEATLKENLRFIEESLGKSLEKYFLTDFYKDHLQTYKKRPIYWLFQSPKKGFSALVYAHRYTKDTVNSLLNKYLRDYLKKLESRINHLVHVEATATATKEKNAARKEAEKLRKDLKDCQDWERNVILPLAQQRLEIDLDDGVKVNYLKFEGAVQPIPGLTTKGEE